MKNFILFYPIYLFVLLYFLFFHENIVSSLLNEFQGKILIEILRLWFDDRIVENYIIINPKYALSIDKSCNAMVPILILSASILAYRVVILYKFLAIILGYFILSIVNVLRIVFVTYMVIEDQNNFSWSHDYIGNGVLAMIGMLLFIWFIKICSPRTH